MLATERSSLLSKWIKPSSEDEKTQQDRAERMVREAIDKCSVFSNVAYRIYTKGSYPNNTNVRRDSDVDVVVQCQACSYYDYDKEVIEKPTGKPYEGPWSQESWRTEVVRALRDTFGKDVVDTSGDIAIRIPPVSGSRPSADVVPSFLYYRYGNSDRTVTYEGSCVWSKAGKKIVNWPNQQLENGRAKNDGTGQRYKNFVRALKNAENYLASQGVIGQKPSYMMECLVWNVEDATLKSGSLDDAFRATLVELWDGLKGTAHRNWDEPNRLKWMFRGDKAWTVDDAKEVVLETWKYLDY